MKLQFISACLVITLMVLTVLLFDRQASGKARIAANDEPDRVATMLNPEENLIFATAFHNLSFSPDGRWLAVGAGSGDVQIWRTDAWVPHQTIKAHDNWSFSVIFSSTSELLITGGGDNTIKIWNLKDLNSPDSVLEAHTMDLHGLALTPDDAKLVSAGDDKVPIVWDLAARQKVLSVAEHPKAITAVAVDSNGQTIATACRDGKVRLFDLNSGELHFSLEGHDQDVMSVRFSPSGDTLASASYDGCVCVWDVDMGYLIEKRTNHSGAAVCVDISPNGKEIVSVDHQKLTFLKADNLVAPPTTLLPKLNAKEQMSFVRYSPDGSTLAVATTDARVLIVDGPTKKVVRVISGKPAAKGPTPMAPNIDAPKK